MAALAVLAVDAGLVGAALGSLLPRPASGASLGLASALLAEASARAFLGGGVGGGTTSFAIVGPAAALVVGGMATAR